MDIRCLKCNSKLSEVKEPIKIKAEKPISIFETKCRKCKSINYYLVPSYLNKGKDK